MSTMDLLAKIRSLKELETLIIQTVMKMDFSTAEIEIEMPEPDVDIPLQIMIWVSCILCKNRV